MLVKFKILCNSLRFSEYNSAEGKSANETLQFETSIKKNKISTVGSYIDRESTPELQITLINEGYQHKFLSFRNYFTFPEDEL